jgi:hypothetical protein
MPDSIFTSIGLFGICFAHLPPFFDFPALRWFTSAALTFSARRGSID